MYINISVAEFRKNMKSYLDVLEDGGSVKVRGLKLIVERDIDTHVHKETENIHNNVTTDTKDVTTVEALREKVRVIESGSGDSFKFLKTIVDETKVCTRTDGKACELCKKDLTPLYQVWEDGDDHILCQDCLKSRHGKGWEQFKGTLVVDEVTPDVPMFSAVIRDGLRSPHEYTKKSGKPMWKVPKKKKENK